MTLPGWMAILGLGSRPAYEVDPGAFAGEFDRPPVVAWSVRLPGPPVPSATHTEMGGPLIHGNRVYVGYAGDDALLVIDRATGALLRRLPAGAAVQAPPVVNEGRLYFSDTAGNTWCYEAETLVARWTHSGGTPILAAPTLAGGRVYVQSVANVVVALDAATGELAWRHAQKLDSGRSFELQLYGSPSPVVAGDLVLSGFADGTLAALEAETGEVAWQRRVGEGQYPDVIGGAVVRGGDVVVAGYTEPLVAIDLATRAVRWRIEAGGAHGAAVGSPQLGEGGDRVVFHGGVDGILRAIDGVTGEVRWQWDSKTGTSLTRPIATEAGLLVGASGGGIHLVDARTGKLRWAWRPGLHLAGVSAEPDVQGRQAVVLTNAGRLTSFVVPREEPGWVREHDVFARTGGR